MHLIVAPWTQTPPIASRRTSPRRGYGLALAFSVAAWSGLAVLARMALG